MTIIIDSGLQTSAYITQRYQAHNPHLLTIMRAAAWAALLSEGNRPVRWTGERMAVMTTVVWRAAEQAGR